MRATLALRVMSIGLMTVGSAPPSQAQEQATFASVLERQFRYAEQDFLAAAEAMPEDKYSFAPTNGEFTGVRTFAQQIKHVGVFNFRSFRAILREDQASDGDNGPDSVRTKAEILQYVRDSFEIGRRAVKGLNAATLLRHVPNSPEASVGFDTPLDLVIFTMWHAYDHYGQTVEYLRMNGIVPPASRGAPLANPPS